jgi:hypothetical protein
MLISLTNSGESLSLFACSQLTTRINPLDYKHMHQCSRQLARWFFGHNPTSAGTKRSLLQGCCSVLGLVLLSLSRFVFPYRSFSLSFFACCETFSPEIQSYNQIGIACLEQKLFLPRLKSWIRNVVAEGGETVDKQLKSKIDEETAEAVKASASAVSAIAKTNQELLASKDEGSISIILVHHFSPLCHY